jgi:murein DD-endopeptidase MepM/ murein hydrolase activator NlpD
VEGRLMDGFARRMDPFSGEGSLHKGVDITAPTGTNVRTTADGVVVQAEMVGGGYGRLVIIDHGGGFQTYYAHLSKILVRAGQELRRGEVIGLVGSSGRTTAPHLHYEVHVGGAPINPNKYLANSGVFHQAPKDLPFQ